MCFILVKVKRGGKRGWEVLGGGEGKRRRDRDGETGKGIQGFDK